MFRRICAAMYLAIVPDETAVVSDLCCSTNGGRIVLQSEVCLSRSW